MSDDRARILTEITNLVRTAHEVVPDDMPVYSQTWMNRVVGLLLWIAEHLDGEIAIENIFEDINEI